MNAVRILSALGVGYAIGQGDLGALASFVAIYLGIEIGMAWTRWSERRREREEEARETGAAVGLAWAHGDVNGAIAGGLEEKHFNRLAKRYPEYLAAVEQLGESVKQAGPLEPKVAELIQLAAAAAVHSEGAVHSHTRRARKAGATPDEINHAVLLLTSTIGFPAVAAALSWVDDA